MKSNKPVIMEFAGLPGAGKTTLLQKIKENKGTELIGRSDMRIFEGSHFKNKIVRPLTKLHPMNRRFSAILDRVAGTYPYSEFGPKELRQLYYYTSLLHRLFPEREIIYDEGFVQFMTSLMFLEPIKDDANFQELIKSIQKKYQIEVVYCEVGVDVALRRMRQRGRNDRYNRITDDKRLMDALTVKKHNLERVLDYFSPYRTLNLNSDILQAVDSFR